VGVEKFPEGRPTLTTQMKSVGEVMASAALQGALQKIGPSLEQDRWALTRSRLATTSFGVCLMFEPDRISSIGDAYALASRPRRYAR